MSYLFKKLNLSVQGMGMGFNVVGDDLSSALFSWKKTFKERILDEVLKNTYYDNPSTKRNHRRQEIKKMISKKNRASWESKKN